MKHDQLEINVAESASYPDVSLLMKMFAQRKAGRRQRARRRFACCLYPSHGPLRFITSNSFRARFCQAKNEAPEEEAVAECSDLRAFLDGREIYHFKAFTQTFNCRGRERWLDEHLKFTGKTNDQRKCSRSPLAEAYVDKRAARKKGSTNKYEYRPTSAGEKSNAPWNRLVDFWRRGRIHCLHLVWLASCKT